MDLGVLIARVVFGSLLAAHGCQKLFGWFGGSGLSGTAAFFESLGFHPGRPFVIATVLAECGGGLMLTLGLLQPVAAAPIIAVMIVAIATVHWGHGLLGPGGIEPPLVYLAVAIALALIGPGAYSLDSLLGLQTWCSPRITALLLTTGAATGVVSLGVRRVGTRAAHA